MSQKLMLPVNDCQMLVGYKNEPYKKHWGFTHYGIDCYDPSLVLWGMGDGEVVKVGEDSVFGNVVVVIYKDVWVHGQNKAMDLVARCYHMAEPAYVKEGQKVTTKEKLGKRGTTGKYSSGVHCHLELDTDTAHPLYVPGLAGNTSLFKKGIDTTIHPADVLYVKPTAPDNQRVSNHGLSGWVTEKDLSFPTWPEEEPPEPDEDYKAKYEEAQVKYAESQMALERANAEIASLQEKIKKAQEALA